MPTEIALCFGITFIHAAPCSPQQKVRNIPFLDSLPFGNLCRGLVFPRSSRGQRDTWRKLVENVFLQKRADFCFVIEVPFTACELKLFPHIGQLSSIWRNVVMVPSV